MANPHVIGGMKQTNTLVSWRSHTVGMAEIHASKTDFWQFLAGEFSQFPGDDSFSFTERLVVARDRTAPYSTVGLSPHWHLVRGSHEWQQQIHGLEVQCHSLIHRRY